MQQQPLGCATVDIFILYFQFHSLMHVTEMSILFNYRLQWKFPQNVLTSGSCFHFTQSFPCPNKNDKAAKFIIKFCSLLSAVLRKLSTVRVGFSAATFFAVTRAERKWNQINEPKNEWMNEEMEAFEFYLIISKNRQAIHVAALIVMKMKLLVNDVTEFHKRRDWKIIL